MKIVPSSSDGPRIDGRPVGTERAVPVQGGSGAGPVPPNAAAEKVTLSSSRDTLFGPAGGVPFDDAKVEAVRRAIAEGRFPVDARRVAERLIEDARELLGIEAPSK